MQLLKVLFPLACFVKVILEALYTLILLFDYSLDAFIPGLQLGELHKVRSSGKVLFQSLNFIVSEDFYRAVESFN